MSNEYRFRILYDSDGCASLEMKFPGFHPAWACATGNEESDFWEFELSSLDGFDMHFAIPYTLSTDLLETFFWSAIKKFKTGAAASLSQEFGNV
jgi:hypothetical protein